MEDAPWGGLAAYRFIESSQEVDFICQLICFGLQLNLVHISTIHILKKRKPKISDETTAQRGFRTPVGPSLCFQVCYSLACFYVAVIKVWFGDFFAVMLDIYCEPEQGSWAEGKALTHRDVTRDQVELSHKRLVVCNRAAPLA